MEFYKGHDRPLEDTYYQRISKQMWSGATNLAFGYNYEGLKSLEKKEAYLLEGRKFFEHEFAEFRESYESL